MYTDYYNIHGLKIRIRTPYRSITNHYKDKLSYFRVEKIDSADIDYYFGNFEKPPNLAKIGNNKWCGEKTLFWQPFAGMQVMVKNLLGETKVYLTKWFNVFIGEYLTNILHTKFIQKNKTLLHCAAVCNGDDALLLSGFGGCGKSSLTYLLLKRGYDYIGDDHVVLSKDGRVYTFPTGMGIDYNAINKLKIDVGVRKKVEAKIRSLLPFVYSSVDINPIPYHSAKVKSIILLERLDSKSEEWLPVDISVAINKLQKTTSTWSEQTWGNLVHAYSYTDDDFDLIKEAEKERNILSSALNSANAYLLRFSSFKLAEQLISRVMQ
jgi:hypothetical protein